MPDNSQREKHTAKEWCAKGGAQKSDSRRDLLGSHRMGNTFFLLDLYIEGC